MKTETPGMGNPPFYPPVVPVILNVPLYGQQTPMWCWAASAQMVLQYIGITVEQCAEANHLFGLNTCCATPVPTECVRGGSPQLNYWGATFDATTKGTALSFAQLQAQIDENMPVIFVWKWIPKGGHVMVAAGYYELEETQLVFVNNPWPPNQGDFQVISYADYVQNPTPPHAHTHGVDLYNIAVAQATPQPIPASQAMSDTPKPTRYADQAAATAAGLQMAYILLKHGNVLPADVTEALTAPGQLSLGTPIAVHTVSYTDLVDYKGSPRLPDPAPDVLYPVLFGHKTVSSVRLRPEGNQWAVSSAGGLNGMNHIQLGLQHIPTYAAQAYVVHIPWLDQLFLAYETAGDIHITHLYSDERLGFVAYTTQPAAEVFPKLASMAQELGDLWEGQL